MGSTLNPIVFVILFWVSAYGSRTTLISHRHRRRRTISSLAPSGDNGICTLMVVKHGYDCQEHTVIIYAFSSSLIYPNIVRKYQMFYNNFIRFSFFLFFFGVFRLLLKMDTFLACRGFQWEAHGIEEQMGNQLFYNMVS